MNEWLIRQAPIMVWVAGTAVGLVGAEALARQIGQLGREGSRTQSRVIIVLVLLALAAGGEALRWQGRQIEGGRPGARWLEGAAAGGIGLVLTVAAAGWFHDLESEASRAGFAELARARSRAFVDSLKDVRDSRLAGLAGFLQVCPEVTRAQFRDYAATLVHGATVQAWEWVPAVPAADRAAFELATRQNGLTNFAISELDAQGHPARSGESGGVGPAQEPPDSPGQPRGAARPRWHGTPDHQQLRAYPRPGGAGAGGGAGVPGCDGEPHALKLPNSGDGGTPSFRVKFPVDGQARRLPQA